MRTNFKQPIYLALVLTLCTLGFASQARTESENLDRDAQFILAQENKDDDEEEFELPELKGIPKNINKIAEQITVRINSPSGNGSGVIFAQDGDEYYVVTAKHVVEQDQIYEVVTEDDKVYEVEPKYITRFEDTDLAILSFESGENYRVAAFSDYSLGLNKESWVFVYGWAKSASEPETFFSVGKVVGKETGLFLVKDDLSLTKTSGYELIYTNLSERGMSGGPVLDTSGRVIGIHTSAEGERYRLTDKLQLGFSLGIPIATFLKSQELKQTAQAGYLELQTTKERADVIPFARPNLSREELDSVATNWFEAPSADATETEWVNYGNQLWRTASYSEAVKAFDKAISKKTNFYQAHYGKGLALYDLGKYQEANKSFKQATNLDSNFYPAWYRQSQTLLNLKQYPQALEVIDRTIALKLENTALYALRGEALQNLERYEEAIASYDRAIAADNNPLILTRRGSISRILGKQDLALQDFNQAIEFDPRYAEGYINRALTYYQLGDNRQALINLNHVVGSITREDPRAYLARGFVYQQLGEETQAKADFVRAFNLYRAKQEAVAEGEEINLQTDGYSQVNIDFRHLMQLNAESANIYFGQGIAYLLLNNRQQAMNSLNQAQAIFKTKQDNFGQNITQRIITQAKQPIKQSSDISELEE